MLRTLLLATSVAALAAPAGAACYADFKAKRDGPLRLQYGVIELSDAACADPGQAAAEIEARIAGDGWQLLNLMSLFGDDGLEKRKERAGRNFLRY